MANKTIAELTAGSSPLDGSELFHGVQGGNSRKFTTDELRGMADGVAAALAQGDLLYVNGDGELVRLPKGTAGQVIAQNDGETAPEWIDQPLLGEGTIVSFGTGTTLDVTGIDADTIEIVIDFWGLSQTANSGYNFRLGISSGIDTDGYAGSGSRIASSSAATTAVTNSLLIFATTASEVLSGKIIITLVEGATNTWSMTLVGGSSSTFTVVGHSVVSLDGPLTRFAFVAGGGGSFDGGKLVYRQRK